MKKKYKANIDITSYGDNTIILFGYFFDYDKLYSKCFKLFNKLLTIKLFKIINKPTCYITKNSSATDIKIDYQNILNKRIDYTRQNIKKNNKFNIPLYNFIISLNVDDYKNYNIDRITNKINNIVLT